MRKPRRGIVLSPEEGAQVRKFVEDAVLGTVDMLLDLGYLRRWAGGLRIGPKGNPEGSVPLSEDEQNVMLELMKSVVIKDPKPEKPIPVPKPEEAAHAS